MLLGWLARYVWLASIQGGFMAGLTPGRGSGGGSSAMMDLAISGCCLVPILALWLPGRLLLGASAVILLARDPHLAVSPVRPVLGPVVAGHGLHLVCHRYFEMAAAEAVRSSANRGLTG